MNKLHKPKETQGGDLLIVFVKRGRKGCMKTIIVVLNGWCTLVGAESHNPQLGAHWGLKGM